jgi:hypothetical protein
MRLICRKVAQAWCRRQPVVDSGWLQQCVNARAMTHVGGQSFWAQKRIDDVEKIGGKSMQGNVSFIYHCSSFMNCVGSGSVLEYCWANAWMSICTAKVTLQHVLHSTCPLRSASKEHIPAIW